MNGSIDWYCYPHFDSPSVFGAILDGKKGGRFQISADADGVRHKQFHWPSTNVLVTRFLLADGIAELEDFVPAGLPTDSPQYHHLYRRIRCVRGAVRISVSCRPAFDYGRQTHDIQIEANGATFKSGSVSLALSTNVSLRDDGHGGVTAEFVIMEGKSQVFILRDDCADGVPCPPSEKEAEQLLAASLRRKSRAGTAPAPGGRTTWPRTGPSNRTRGHDARPVLENGLFKLVAGKQLQHLAENAGYSYHAVVVLPLRIRSSQRKP
jgi:hypothetical protein